MAVGALGAWWAWLGAGARVDVSFVWVAGGLWAAGVLLPCVWRFVLSGGAWLVCALGGWCGTRSAWVVSVWVFGFGCWLWVRRLRGVVGRDGGFSDVRGRLVVRVVRGVVSGAGSSGRVGLGLVVVVVVAGLLVLAAAMGDPDGGPRVCGGRLACMVVVGAVFPCGCSWVWYREACGLR